ncbi:MAG TPA: hypothetical protein VMI75_21475, partial [Polyangiaceae bacterium]|nr:hypothetical protein [Polyangiaceae bacterium]
MPVVDIHPGRGGCTIAFQDSALWTLLSQTDKLALPAGLTATAARAALKSAAANVGFKPSAGRFRSGA